MFSSCFGRRSHPRADEEQPLLSHYEDDTVLQRRLHQKLHTLQMLRALSKGYMPSTEQAIVNLRTLLSAAILNPDNENLSDSGRALVHYIRQWITQFIHLLQNKNGRDQIQDLIWSLAKARVSVDMEAIAEQAGRAKAKADTAALYRSFQTVGSLLLTNSDFRLFLSDLNVVAREVFRDTAFALSEASKEAGKRLEPSSEEQAALKKPGQEAESKPANDELKEQAAEIAEVLENGTSKVLAETQRSIVDKLQGEEKDTMLERLKQAVLKLRQRRDYSDSVSTLSLLLKRYAMTYSRVAENALETAEDAVDRNLAVDKAAENLWLFVRSFGDSKEWDELEKRFKQVMEHGQKDPEFENLTKELGNAAQEMMTNPEFLDDAEKHFQDLRDRSRKLTSRSSLRDDIDGLLSQLHTVFVSILRDQDIANLIKTSKMITKILSPKHHYANADLLSDTLNVFIPLVFQSIQYIPIPRLEVSTPQIDLLLENLILEPGVTINHSSFFPFKLRIETLNDIEIRKARFRTTSAVKSLTRIRIDGISIRAEEVGFWLRAHSWPLWLADEGIGSFELDERGLDIQLDVEVGRDRLEKILSLRKVRVHIHKLNYKLRKSKFSLFAWLLKPLLKPILCKTMELQIATAIKDGLHFANRELIFARERLRATRVADPHDLKTFFKAVMARLTPPDDPDLQTRIGIAQPGNGVFEGVYAPGSVVKLWNEEAGQAKQRIREGEEDGWRNRVFDVHATLMG